jgi:hypothetical protein
MTQTRPLLDAATFWRAVAVSLIAHTLNKRGHYAADESLEQVLDQLITYGPDYVFTAGDHAARAIVGEFESLALQRDVLAPSGERAKAE